MSDVQVRLIEAGFTHHPGFVVERGGPWRPVPFPALCALIHHPRHGPVLYDAGYSHAFDAATRWFPERFYRMLTPVTAPPELTAAGRLCALGIEPDDVRHVILSHFHADHVGGAADFPRATYHASGAGWDRVKGLGRWRATLRGFIPAFLPDDFTDRLRRIDGPGEVALPSPLEHLGRGWDLFGDGALILFALPGHARGQLGLYVEEAAGGSLLFVADACWTTRAYRELRFPNPIANLIFDSRSDYRDTLHQLHEIHRRAPDMRIVPSHCVEAARGLDVELACSMPHPSRSPRR